MARSGLAVKSIRGSLVLAALVTAGCIAVLSRPTGGSASERARQEVQSLFVDFIATKQKPQVKSCDQIASDAAARIYLCEIVAPTCDRIFRFAVYRGSAYRVTPVTASLYMLRHPCTPVHT